jgi:hypothetical protein
MPQDQQFSPSIRVGCSGWQYQHWRGDFYPAALSQTKWFDYIRAVFQYRRDQQFVLSAARGGNFCRLAPARAASVPLCGEGQPTSSAVRLPEAITSRLGSLLNPLNTKDTKDTKENKELNSRKATGQAG